MPISFLDLPLELREEVYKLALLIEREPNGELFSVITDKAYWEDYSNDDGMNPLRHNVHSRTLSEEVIRLGIRLMTTCRQMNEEVTPYVYGQLQFLFYRPQQALEWLDKTGHYKIHLFNVAIAGIFRPDEALNNGRQIQADIWASFLQNVRNLTSLNCLVYLHTIHWRPFDWSHTLWNNEAVLEAIQNLAHLRALHLDAVPRADGCGFSVWESSLEPAFDKPLLETLVVKGNPVAGIKWYHEDYFDRLVALKHLTILNGCRMQSGNSKVAKDFFSHVALLRSFTWHGHYFMDSHQKASSERHGGTLQFLDLSTHLHDWSGDMTARQSEELGCQESLTNIFGALPVLKALKLSYWRYCAKLIENMPRSLTVLDLNGGGATGDDFPNTAQDRSLGHALRKLPDRCPQLAHVRLAMCQRVADEQDMGRCRTLSIHNHAAVKHVSSRIHDTFVPFCVAHGCGTAAPLDPELTTKLQQSLWYLQSGPIAEIDLARPWNRYYASIEAVPGSKHLWTW